MLAPVLDGRSVAGVLRIEGGFVNSVFRVTLTWQVSGLLDREAAACGATLWDVGSLFRYSHRYGVEFREGFARGYRAAGGTLPEDWWRTARLLDATRLVAILDGEALLTEVFAECRARPGTFAVQLDDLRDVEAALDKRPPCDSPGFPRFGAAEIIAEDTDGN